MKKELFKAWDIEAQSWIDDFMVDPYGTVFVLDEDNNVMTNERDITLVSVLHHIGSNGIYMKESDVIRVKGVRDGEDYVYVLVENMSGVTPIRLIVEERKFVKETIDNITLREFAEEGKIDIIGNVFEEPNWLIDLSRL